MNDREDPPFAGQSADDVRRLVDRPGLRHAVELASTAGQSANSAENDGCASDS
jgi:hypothetical protein